MKKIIITFLIFGLANFLIAQPVVTNGDFESWTTGIPDGWTLQSDDTDITYSQGIGVGFTGDALEIVGNTNGSSKDGEFYTSVYVTGIVEGNSYDIRIKTNSNDDKIKIRFWDTRWYDVTNAQVGSDIDDLSYNPATGGSWTDYQAQGTIHTAPTGATQLKIEIRVYIQSGFVSGTSNILVDDLTVTNVTSDPANIIKAYAINSTAIDLEYDKEITSVNVLDYSLTGTNSVSFANAIIDGTDAKVVHLTGASPAMIGDITLDEVSDSENGSSYEFYAGIMPISYTNTNNSGGTMDNTHTATFQGIVSANDSYNNVWVSDAIGQYNGILIYDSGFDGLVSVGDEIIFTAIRSPYNGLSELVNPSLISELSSGNTPYGPSEIIASDINETILVDTDPAEPWEGQLVKIHDFTVDSKVSPNYSCSWTDDKATYVFHIGDNVDYLLEDIDLLVGSTYYAITGVVDWDGSRYRINPRNQGDVELSEDPIITKVFAISTTAVDVYYDKPISSIVLGDYYITGTDYIWFTGATIDPENDQLVHLTGANSAMVSDLTLDELTYDDLGTSMEFYAGISDIAFTNTTNPGSTMLDDISATFSGIVSANNEDNGVWISDATGQYNGVLIFDYDFLPDEVTIGDEIIFSAIRSPYNNLTQLKDPILISSTSGNTPYGPSDIDGSDIENLNPVDTDPAEAWEGHLVKISDFTVDSLSAFSPNYVCSWSDSKADYVFYVGDNAGTFSLSVGASYTSVTGVIDWAWTGGFYRINPRNQEDIEGGELPPAPDIIITEVMQNPDSVSDNNGEWFEVYNNSADPVDMNGWVMKDLGTNSHTISESLVVPAYGFAVLGNDNLPGTNGGYTCDYMYSSFALGNSDDELILYTPGEAQEVDRIEWDGGSVWPDPTGASMVYTGLPSEDNNDGSLWATSSLAELSYGDPACDYGSPGTNGQYQVFTEGFSLSLKVFLEGPYDVDTDAMTSNFFISNDHPFNPDLPYYGNSTQKWLYNGDEVSPKISSSYVDWVLVELRDETYSKAAPYYFPAFVEGDGQVICYNGSSRISVKETFTNNVFIVIWHRNHLGIMSAVGLNPVAGTLESFDFTTGADKVYDGTLGYKELETDVWGMVAGDVNADGYINDLDTDDGWSTEAGENGYLGGDLNLDGESNNIDKNELWFENRIIYESAVPN